MSDDTFQIEHPDTGERRTVYVSEEAPISVGTLRDRGSTRRGLRTMQLVDGTAVMSTGKGFRILGVRGVTWRKVEG